MERGKIIDEIIHVKGIPDNLSDEGFEQLLNTVESLCDDERILTEAKCSVNPRKAKEIALQAAISIRPNYIPPSTSLGQNQLGCHGPIYDVVTQAEKIYQWLIKE